MWYEIIALLILMSSMLSIIIVSYGKQQHKYNRKRWNRTSMNEDEV